MTIVRPISIPSKREIRPEYDPYQPDWVHPKVKYYQSEWMLLRDAIDGEREIKDQRERYLPCLDGMDPGEYDAYLDRATYYNFTGRTIGALEGALFKRPPRITGVADANKERLDRLTIKGDSLMWLMHLGAREYMSVFRMGMLVDLPAAATVNPEPYVVPYTAENILWWEWGVPDPTTGRKVLTRLVLREWQRKVAPKTAYFYEYDPIYRELSLEPDTTGRMVYGQRVFLPGESYVPGEALSPRVVPLRRGEPLTEIPFEFIGEVEPERPLMVDIARLNISHYRSYAHLEHGRFYTGVPIYWAEVSGSHDGGAEYYLGAAKVWELEKGCRAGLLEFNGAGLRFLEGALAAKEAQAASLGGRMIGVTAQSTAETDNQTKLKERNEQSLLMLTAAALDKSFTKVLRLWSWWSGFDEVPEVVFSKDFMYDTVGSREFRAVQSMYKDGILPIEVLYDYMRRADVIPAEMEIEEFTALLQNESSFPGQPDWKARQEGYPNAQARQTEALKLAELDLEEQALIEERRAAKAAEKAAANRPPPQPFGGAPAGPAGPTPKRVR
jgi:hypothetical protein